MVTQPKAAHLVRAEKLLERLRIWAQTEEDVRALVVVGSFARGDAGPDSDLDVVMMTRDPSKYLDDTTWLSTLGKAVVVGLESYGRVTSVRVLLDDELDIEVGVAPANWASEPYDAGTEHVARGGIVILSDRDGHATALAAAMARLSGTAIPDNSRDNPTRARGD